MKNFNIKKMKLITLIITTIIFVSVGSFRVYNDTTILNTEHNKKEKIILEHIRYLYQKQMKNLNKSLGSRIKYIAVNKNVQDAFKTKDTAKLQKIVLQRFKIMKKAFPTLSNMKFFTKDKKLLFVVNKNIDIYKKNGIPTIARQVIKTHKSYFGFGPYFKYDKETVYKIAIPIFNKKEFLGVIATSIDMSYLIKEIGHDIESIYSKNINVAFFLKNDKKRKIDKTKFIKYSSYITPNFNNYFTYIIPKITTINNKYAGHIDLNNRNYHTSFGQIKINDFNKKTIGTLSYIIDETDYVSLLNKLKIKAILFPLIIMVLLLLFFNWLFHYFSKKLIDTYNRTKKIIDTQDSFIVISSNGNMKECNQAVLDFFGFKTFKTLTNIHSCICDFFLQKEGYNYLNKIDNNNISWSKYILDNPNKIHKVLLKNKNNSFHIFEVKAKEFEYQDDIKEAIFIFNDITLLEAEKEESSKKEKLIFEQAKMVSMGEMIGNIAHQWRQPLSVISTGATGILLQKEYGNITDEFLIDTCEAIDKNAQYLSKTIDDFKNFIKGDRTRKVFNLKDNINSFLHLIEGVIKSHQINIILNLDENIKIDGYENELTQCFINIFNNAKDVLVEKKIEDKYIFISARIINNNVNIKIKDNAGGIAEDILPKIFEPYFTTKHQSQGTGLGLHMTYNLIVDGMEGDIVVKNSTYKYNQNNFTGAEFIIQIPIKESNIKGKINE